MDIRVFFLIWLSFMAYSCSGGAGIRKRRGSGQAAREAKVYSAYRRVQDARPKQSGSPVANNPLNVDTQWLPYLSPGFSFVHELAYLILTTKDDVALNRNHSFPTYRHRLGWLYEDIKQSFSTVYNTMLGWQSYTQRLDRYVSQTMQIINSGRHPALEPMSLNPLSKIEKALHFFVPPMKYLALDGKLHDAQRWASGLYKDLVNTQQYYYTVVPDENRTMEDLDRTDTLIRTGVRATGKYKNSFLTLHTFLRFWMAQGYQTEMSAAQFLDIASSYNRARPALNNAALTFKTSSVHLKNMCQLYVELFDRYKVDVPLAMHELQSIPASEIDNRQQKLLEAMRKFKEDISQIAKKKRLALKRALALM